jgi:hypothetical protein
MMRSLLFLASGLTDQGDYYLKHGPDFDQIQSDCMSIKDVTHPLWTYAPVEHDEIDQLGL